VDLIFLFYGGDTNTGHSRSRYIRLESLSKIHHGGQYVKGDGVYEKIQQEIEKLLKEK
jgi:hypothetical protein